MTAVVIPPFFYFALCTDVHYDTHTFVNSHSVMASQFTVHGRLWLEGPDGTILGHGRVELLEKIDDLGSLRAAASALGMSYRYAWKLVKSMNDYGDAPLISLNAGGRGGGHAVLTEAGKEAVAAYRRTDREFEQFLSEQSDKRPD